MKILVVKPDAIGDLVLATPVFKALKEKYVGAHLTLFAKPFAKDLLFQNPYIDEFTTEADFKGYDLVLHLFKDQKYIVDSFLNRNRIRVGEGSNIIQSLLLTHKTNTYNDITLHQVEQNVALLKPLGITNPSTELLLKVDPSIKMDLTGSPLVALSIGQTGKHNKYWTPKGFEAVANLLIKKYGARVILLGSSDEIDISKQINVDCINLVGKLTIKELVYVISKCRLHIRGDTGPMHIAAALKIPSVAIFTTKDHKPLRWGPWRSRHIVLRKPTNCEDLCVPGNCNRSTCSDEITPDEVFSAACSLLEGNKGSDFSDWCKKSFNILSFDEKISKILSDSGYNVYSLNNNLDLLSFLIKNDINIIHCTNFDLKIFINSILYANKIGKKPLVLYKTGAFNSADDLIKYYIKKFKTL